MPEHTPAKAASAPRGPCVLVIFPGTGEGNDALSVSDDGLVRDLAYGYPGQVETTQGIGTRLGLLGAIAGGVTGAGTRDRVKEAMAAIGLHHRRAQDAREWLTIDLIGRSRGGDIAARTAVECDRVGLEVRSLLLFDPVSQMGFTAILNSALYATGLPLVGRDGLPKRIPSRVKACLQLMALDEKRFFLPPVVFDMSESYDVVWCPGNHGQVGGVETVRQNTRARGIATDWARAAWAGETPVIPGRNSREWDIPERRRRFWRPWHRIAD